MMRHLVFAGVLVAMAPGIMTAQPGYGRSRRGGGQGHDIARIIADCEQRTDEFRRSFRHALDDSRYRGTMRQEDLTRHADRLARVMDRVRQSWNRERNVDKTRHFVSEAINTSQDINRTMIRARLHPEVERQWRAIRSELNRLAEAFALPQIRW